MSPEEEHIMQFFAFGHLPEHLQRASRPFGELAGDLGDLLKSFGVVIASVGGALPVPDLLRRLVGAGGGKVLMALIAGGVLAAGSILPGCAGSVYQARSRAHLDWTPQPKCHIEVRLDDDPKPVVTVDAPTSCELPPDACPAETSATFPRKENP